MGRIESLTRLRFGLRFPPLAFNQRSFVSVFSIKVEVPDGTADNQCRNHWHGPNAKG